MKYTLAFSPCPNDTFIFDALVNHKIDTDGISFDVQLEDVETLNEWALQGRMDFSKISYGVLHLVRKQYLLLSSGGALGKGVGPLLVSKNKAHHIQAMDHLKIAIPGKHTTAYLLFLLAFPTAKNTVFKVFNEIEDAVLSGEVDAGVIIHENRFTYEQKGLVKLVDLGAFWEASQHIPIPLGGIIAKKTIDPIIINKVDLLIRKSIEYAFIHYPQISDYVREHAQEMSDDTMQKHIELYVNNFSLDLGDEGRKAVEVLTSIAHRTQINLVSTL
ncbi:MAG: 1,4-dihydroxy-6-naphthoate synthase [Sphingobacteriia bacterium]|nr:MAG: 1,4-dihydroxy-6-naphthoate synthase [Sphingobacteriia bacterium]TAG31596.1 MAG: 1,4-dihydroxy-6-naphthoate synthase [Sphingobacteriia bacterium]